MSEMMFPIPPLSKLPHFQKSKLERGVPDFTLEDYLENEGIKDFAVALAHFFWPRFIEVAGCVLREECYSPDNFKNWFESLEGNTIKIESVINHIHLYDFMNQGEVQYDLEVHEYLAQMVMRMWKASLSSQFPDKTFTFIYTTEPDDYGPTIHFYQTPLQVEGNPT